MGEPDDKLARLLSTVTMLKQIELFREVSAHYLTSIAEIVEPVAMVAGEELFQEGDPGDACYLVCEGKVTVRAGGVEIATLGRGECLGELALLDGRPRCTRSMSVDGTPRSYSRPEASSDYLAWQRSRSSATGRTSFLLIRLGLSRSLTREA